MYILRKRAEKLKKNCFLYFVTTFHVFAPKIETCWAITQQIFVVPQDVLKTFSGHVLKTSSTCLQRNNYMSSKTSSRRLEDVLQIRLEEVLKTPWWHLAKRLEDVLKTSWKTKNCYSEDVLKTSHRKTKYLLGISVSDHSLLANLHQYLADLYPINLFFKNLRRIQNALIRTQEFLYQPYFETQSAELIQNWHCRTGEAIKRKF